MIGHVELRCLVDGKKNLPCQLEGTHTLKLDGLLLLFMRKPFSTDTSFTVTAIFVCLAIVATIGIVYFTVVTNVTTSSIYSDAIPISASLARGAEHFVNTDFISRSFHSSLAWISSNIPRKSWYNILKYVTAASFPVLYLTLPYLTWSILTLFDAEKIQPLLQRHYTTVIFFAGIFLSFIFGLHFI